MSGIDRLSLAPHDWCLSISNVTEFGRCLVEEGISASNLQYYYEKPWKWTEEREAWLQTQRQIPVAEPTSESEIP